jgi:hypothetical protein
MEWERRGLCGQAAFTGYRITNSVHGEEVKIQILRG